MALRFVGGVGGCFGRMPERTRGTRVFPLAWEWGGAEKRRAPRGNAPQLRWTFRTKTWSGVLFAFALFGRCCGGCFAVGFEGVVGAGLGDGVEAVGVGHDGRVLVEGGKAVGDELFALGDGVVPGDFLSGVGAHAAYDGSHAGVGAVVGVVERGILTNGLVEFGVFNLVGIAAAALACVGADAIDDVAFVIGDDTLAHFEASLGADDDFADLIGGVGKCRHCG